MSVAVIVQYFGLDGGILSLFQGFTRLKIEPRAFQLLVRRVTVVRYEPITSFKSVEKYSSVDAGSRLASVRSQ
jgi:hypothetical protein